MFAAQPRTVKATKPATLTLTRQSKAVETWTSNIGKDAKAKLFKMSPALLICEWQSLPGRIGD
jgi:hypothetical protein